MATHFKANRININVNKERLQGKRRKLPLKSGFLSESAIVATLITANREKSEAKQNSKMLTEFMKRGGDIYGLAKCCSTS